MFGKILSRNREKIKVFWLTDSGADLPEGVPEPNHILPFRLVGKDFSLMDGIEISPERLSELAKKQKKNLRSSEPPQEDFLSAYDAALKTHDFVFVITVSKHVSRTFFSASVAAREFPNKVFVFDSNSASVGEGAFYHLLRKHIDNQKLTKKRKSTKKLSRDEGTEVKKALLSFRPRIKTYVHSRSQIHLRKFGNLGTVESKLVKLSGFLPLYQTGPQNPPKLVGIFASKDALLKKLKNLLTEEILKLKNPQIWIAETEKLPVEASLKDQMEKVFRFRKITVKRTTPGTVLRFVAGEEFFAVSVFESEKENEEQVRR